MILIYACWFVLFMMLFCWIRFCYRCGKALRITIDRVIAGDKK